MTTPTPHTTPTELAKTYQPNQVESQIAERWLAAKAFHAEPADTAEQQPYAIVIPPPNVTAALHLGHALNNTLQDILIRYHRMLGRNTMWMPGTDHAGIATQTVVDKRLQQEGQPALKDYKKLQAQGKPGREQFIEKVQAWKDEYEKRITDQLKEMGCSCDWDRQRFTMDPVCAKAVREAFFKLFKDGLIYRGKRLVNWDPVTQTALADDEVEMQDVDGNFYYMKYPLVDDAGNDTGETITVATTRPETMLGDTAVAVNPHDEKRAHLVGRKIKLPIVGRIIRIIGDEHVVIPDEKSSDAKARYASGFLKVTPAHDPNDYEIGQRHSLDVINVMAPDASISADHGWPEGENPRENPQLAAFLGLSREYARREIVKWFKAHDLMAEVRPYRHAVGHSYRSHVPIEPYLSDQWYVKVTDEKLRGKALRAMAEDQREPTPAESMKHGEEYPDWEGQLRFTPTRYAKTFQTWHENIRDWCISRQLWWGHRIPVWTAEELAFPNEESAERFQRRFGEYQNQGRIWKQSLGQLLAAAQNDAKGGIGLNPSRLAVCVRQEDDDEVIRDLEAAGYQQDPDVLDTWFSSALWPLSTMGWPEDTPELHTWNPTNVLCTAREIITLWVSRMVMFNLYLRDCLPFHDVFIHAMIQDGHGQKMSKSLGNGVDPMDIIHSHGSDAMRFTLASMTTHTQDVRLPVDMVCPHTGERFVPEYITNKAGYKVAAPIQQSPDGSGRKMVSSYGYASGEAVPTDEMPLARNTSEKFDLGQRFANKMWNAARFALANLEAARPDADEQGPGPGTGDDLADKWILTRLAQTVAAANDALREYEFASFATTLYDFFWRDLCDWYIEIVKPTVAAHPRQRQVLAVCLDASLRLLHPVMPFITERLWQRLNEVVPARQLEGIKLPQSDLLIRAAWPKVDQKLLVDQKAAKTFALMQQLVSAIREMRTTHKVPPRQVVEVSAKAPPALCQTMLAHRDLIATLSNMGGGELGPNVERPADAAATVVGDIELYVHGVIDADTERTRLEKRAEELSKSIKMLTGRLSSESYVNKAPAKLVQETRDQLAAAQREAESIKEQLASLD